MAIFITQHWKTILVSIVLESLSLNVDVSLLVEYLVKLSDDLRLRDRGLRECKIKGQQDALLFRTRWWLSLKNKQASVEFSARSRWIFEDASVRKDAIVGYMQLSINMHVDCCGQPRPCVRS